MNSFVLSFEATAEEAKLTHDKRVEIERELLKRIFTVVYQMREVIRRQLGGDADPSLSASLELELPIRGKETTRKLKVSIYRDSAVFWLNYEYSGGSSGSTIARITAGRLDADGIHSLRASDYETILTTLPQIVGDLLEGYQESTQSLYEKLAEGLSVLRAE